MSQLSSTQVSEHSFYLLHESIIDSYSKEFENYKKADLPKSEIKRLRKELFGKIKKIGKRIGTKLAENLLKENTKRIKDREEMFKFLAKTVWRALYSRSANFLEKNDHSTKFFLHDHVFTPYRGLSASNSTDTQNIAHFYTIFTCGVIEGYLMTQSVTAIVHAEISEFPKTKFVCSIDNSRSMDREAMEN
mmetsp:Transcript_918/g.1442  ORF Transcript_918/g.1442 Transcript_918/m.1442 type:complete len:190 (-) Transcript_918:9-578(-)